MASSKAGNSGPAVCGELGEQHFGTSYVAHMRVRFKKWYAPILLLERIFHSTDEALSSSLFSSLFS